MHNHLPKRLQARSGQFRLHLTFLRASVCPAFQLSQRLALLVAQNSYAFFAEKNSIKLTIPTLTHCILTMLQTSYGGTYNHAYRAWRYQNLLEFIWNAHTHYLPTNLSTGYGGTRARSCQASTTRLQTKKEEPKTRRASARQIQT